MSNIIEEFLDAREFNYEKTFDVSRAPHIQSIRVEQYIIDKNDTLDGLKLSILVKTAFNNDRPIAQDFTIVSNRGVTVHATVADVFDGLRKFL